MRETANLERLSSHSATGRDVLVQSDQTHVAQAFVANLSQPTQTGAYLPVNQIGVSDHCGELGIAISPLRAFIDISAADDGQSIVHNADFGMDIHLRRLLNVSPRRGHMSRPVQSSKHHHAFSPNSARRRRRCIPLAKRMLQPNASRYA